MIAEEMASKRKSVARNVKLPYGDFEWTGAGCYSALRSAATRPRRKTVSGSFDKREEEEATGRRWLHAQHSRVLLNHYPIVACT